MRFILILTTFCLFFGGVTTLYKNFDFLFNSFSTKLSWAHVQKNQFQRSFEKQLTLLGSGYGYLDLDQFQCFPQTFALDLDLTTSGGNISMFLEDHQKCLSFMERKQ